MSTQTLPQLGQIWKRFMSRLPSAVNQADAIRLFPGHHKKVEQPFTQVQNEQKEALTTLQVLLEEILLKLDTLNQAPSEIRPRMQVIVDNAAGLYDTFR